ncbi:MAG TPA: low molecular weight phosphatase family protein [Chthonomonadaceae bacterium]|nr:low molecular weight phosphatase family protein [Chthonomonadaceae bacterium]
MTHIVLFICTGNYYRSRFAEIVFNYLAGETQVGWAADSRGLTHDISGNVGPISPYALAGLEERHIALSGPPRFPMPLLLEDLEQATTIIGMDEEEHRPVLEQRFPDWKDRIEYWRVHDVHQTSVSTALAAIESQVRALLERLTNIHENEA